MQQFFIESLDQLKLNSEQMHQVHKVLRMRKGEQVRLVDRFGNGAICEFISDDLQSLKIVEPLTFRNKNYKLRIIASLIRAERLEWMIQKACECGVDEIVLYRSDHGVVRDFGNRENRKIERLNAIAMEASEQSYRQFRLVVKGIIDDKELENYRSDMNFFADFITENHLYHQVQPNKSFSVIIGPEGGFSQRERTLFQASGYLPVSLGTQVLRAETASIVTANICALLEVMENHA